MNSGGSNEWKQIKTDAMLSEYRKQQNLLRQIATAQHLARCEQERRAAMVWLFPLLGFLAVLGWLGWEILGWLARGMR